MLASTPPAVVIGYLDQPYSFSEDGGVATVRVAVVSGILSGDLTVNILSEDRSQITNPAVGKFSNYVITSYRI